MRFMLDGCFVLNRACWNRKPSLGGMCMTLPGKLCVGILEEDNPLKSFFRFKPLLIAQEGGYQPFSSAEPFPESGCLRIVPDKNESGHFKARMRRIGRYALLDLREHPGENDKIRPAFRRPAHGGKQFFNAAHLAL